METKMPNKTNDTYILRYSITILILGLTPLIAIFFASFNENLSNTWLNSIYEKIQELPSSYSQTHPIISTIFSNYIKLSPIFSLLFIFCIWGKLKLSDDILEKINFQSWFYSFFPFTLIVILVIFFTYFYSTNLSESWRYIQKISKTKELLLIYYSLAFTAVYFCFCLFFICFIYIPYKTQARK